MPAIFHDSLVPENYILVGGVRTEFGEQFVAVVTKTTTYVITLLDNIILCDASSGAFTVTLPPAANGKIVYNIKKIDSSGNIVTIDGDGSETIDGDLTVALTAQYESIPVVSNLSNWSVL